MRRRRGLLIATCADLFSSLCCFTASWKKSTLICPDESFSGCTRSEQVSWLIPSCLTFAKFFFPLEQFLEKLLLRNISESVVKVEQPHGWCCKFLQVFMYKVTRQSCRLRSLFAESDFARIEHKLTPNEKKLKTRDKLVLNSNRSAAANNWVVWLVLETSYFIIPSAVMRLCDSGGRLSDCWLTAGGAVEPERYRKWGGAAPPTCGFVPCFCANAANESTAKPHNGIQCN